MATLKLGTTTAITESSGAITVPTLGTVTSGNLSNSAIVYPAGHVVQVQTSDYKNKRSVGAWVTSTAFSWSTYSCAVTMTNCTAGNKIILIGNDSGYQGEWDKSTIWAWFVKDGANSEVNIGDLAINSGGMEGSLAMSQFYVNNSANDWGIGGVTQGYYTVQGSSGSSIEFRLCSKVNAASTNVWSSWTSQGMAMEVQA